MEKNEEEKSRKENLQKEGEIDWRSMISKIEDDIKIIGENEQKKSPILEKESVKDLISRIKDEDEADSEEEPFEFADAAYSYLVSREEAQRNQEDADSFGEQNVEYNTGGEAVGYQANTPEPYAANQNSNLQDNSYEMQAGASFYEESTEIGEIRGRVGSNLESALNKGDKKKKGYSF